MKKKYTHTYALLLAAFLLAANVTLSVKPTYAHYEHTTVWNTVLPADVVPVSSDCLSADAEQTILLGQIPAEGKQIQFTMEAAVAASGKLKWTADSDLLQVSVESMQIEGQGTLDADPATAQEVLENDQLVELGGGSQVTVVLKLTPKAPITEETEVNLQVTWGDLLKGTFRGTLEQTAAINEEPIDPTEPEVTEPTEPEVTDPVQTEEPVNPVTEEPEATDPTDPVQPETEDVSLMSLTDSTEPEPITETEENTTQPEETTQPPQTTDPSTEETDPTEETTEPTQTPTDPSVEQTDPTEESTDPSQPEVTPDPELPEGLQVSSLGSFDPAESLPIHIRPSAAGDRLVLTMKKEADTENTAKLFPAYTRYSTDGGESWFLLYESDVITLTAQDTQPIPMLLDLSRQSLTAADQLLIEITEYAGDAAVATLGVEVLPNMNLADYTQPRFLTLENKTMEVLLPEGWANCGFAFTVEMLTVNSDGEPVYREVTQSAESFTAVHTLAVPESEGQPAVPEKITLQLGELLPPAGTYRLTMMWTFEDVCFQTTQMTFFINYSNDTLSQGTGGAGQ